ncbi:PREDICTED: protein eyes shut homolog [Galeopterus variegatus]|uniref:Protein eyes shut homolog n=1 Tax=Galeopterus variegatus TaxID=482537 RepID=A0ABM0RRM6_GALVR|nr:PREDICTED: protein eyes shut homolog [Galeopterus variegatus]
MENYIDQRGRIERTDINFYTCGQSIFNNSEKDSFCEEPTKPCISQSCWKRQICQNNSSAYICECLEGFLCQNCETDAIECLPILCQNGSDSINITNNVTCNCSTIFTGKFCKKIQTSYESFPWKNIAMCMKCEKDYHCSCMPELTGKNSEKVIEHCRLLSINCLSEGWCFNIIGRIRYVCTPGCTRNSCWFVKNVYFTHLYLCYYGSTCHDICQAKGPPQFEYVWQLRFTGSEGEICDMIIDTYFFLAANCTGGAVYENKPEDINSACLFLGEGTIQMCASGCRCLSEKDSQGCWCPCILRRSGKIHLENATDYQENGCQHEAVRKNEINRTRYLCIV